ncbi:hypothetical protein [Streptomyces subrutilus]|uniref:hypothetical protein n=1 Tax=Streptomyces subrutilus TaxID=36818 RepID=UPI002E0F50E4|nr:hypothetical protein OG479_32710 [Streptomyces subrutilus]
MSALTRTRTIHELFVQQPARLLGTGEVWRYCRAHGVATCRKTVRDDLERLAVQGLLSRHGADNGRRYLLVREGR